MSERVSPPADLEYILDDLKKEGIFTTKQKGMMFAAAVGYAQRDSGKPAAPASLGEGIRMEYFVRPRDVGFIDALAVTDANDLLVLASEKDDARVACFEAYANRGLLGIKKACYESGVGLQQGILNLIDSLRTPDAGALPGLDKDLNALKGLI